MKDTKTNEAVSDHEFVRMPSGLIARWGFTDECYHPTGKSCRLLGREVPLICGRAEGQHTD